ncbi:MAG: hypothetical protein WKF74_02790 [Pyrinomonadaceae bacterium]
MLTELQPFGDALHYLQRRPIALMVIIRVRRKHIHPAHSLPLILHQVINPRAGINRIFAHRLLLFFSLELPADVPLVARV